MRIDDKNFRPIDRVNKFDSWDILRMGCKGQIELYTVIKRHLVLSYDYREVFECPHTGDEIIAVAEHDAEITYDYGDMVQLPTVAMEDLLLNGTVDELTLYQVFASSDTNLQLHSTAQLDPITIEDVYVDISCVGKHALSSTANVGNKQSRREAVFKVWLEGKNQKDVSEMKRKDVWDQLGHIDPDLFKSDFKHFFRVQNFIVFNSGRRNKNS